MDSSNKAESVFHEQISRSEEKEHSLGTISRIELIVESNAQLGRLVSIFDSSTWDNALREIIFHGNLGKFQSDITLVDALLETENAVLVEASPYDGIYGAGLAESDLLNPDGTLKVMPENWKNPKNGTQATNHLGFVLMGIRDLFRQLMGHSWCPGEEYHSL